MRITVLVPCVCVCVCVCMSVCSFLPPRASRPRIVVFDSNLIQHVNSPTYIRGNILDLVLTTLSLIIDKVVTQSPPKLLSLDHFVISFTLTCNVSSSARYKPGYVLDHTKADYHGMCSYLLDVDF